MLDTVTASTMCAQQYTQILNRTTGKFCDMRKAICGMDNAGDIRRPWFHQVINARQYQTHVVKQGRQTLTTADLITAKTTQNGTRAEIHGQQHRRFYRRHTHKAT